MPIKDELDVDTIYADSVMTLQEPGSVVLLVEGRNDLKLVQLHTSSGAFPSSCGKRSKVLAVMVKALRAGRRGFYAIVDGDYSQSLNSDPLPPGVVLTHYSDLDAVAFFHRDGGYVMFSNYLDAESDPDDRRECHRRIVGVASATANLRRHMMRSAEQFPLSQPPFHKIDLPAVAQPLDLRDFAAEVAGRSRGSLSVSEVLQLLPLSEPEPADCRGHDLWDLLAVAIRKSCAGRSPARRDMEDNARALISNCDRFAALPFVAELTAMARDSGDVLWHEECSA